MSPLLWLVYHAVTFVSQPLCPLDYLWLPDLGAQVVRPEPVRAADREVSCLVNGDYSHSQQLMYFSETFHDESGQ